MAGTRGAVGDGLAINFGARSVAHMCTQDMHSERDERNSQSRAEKTNLSLFLSSKNFSTFSVIYKFENVDLVGIL